MQANELVMGSFKILGLSKEATLSEVRTAYLDKTSQKKFCSVIFLNEVLEGEFIKYYEAYVYLLKYFSESDDTKALDYYPTDQVFKFIFNQGLYFLLNQNFLKASEKFQEAYKLSAKDPLVLIYIGIILIKRKNYYAAEKYFLQAIKIDDKNDDAWFYLGENYYRAGDFKKALNMFQTAKTLNSANPDLPVKLKELREKLGIKSRPSSRLKKIPFYKRLLK